MASFNKFNQFVADLGLKVHNLNTDALKVYLSNTAPNAATMAIKSDLAEIATGNGYTGPVGVSNTYSQTSGTGNLAGTDQVITATGAVGPFRYVVLYNDTSVTPLKPLIGWWDYGSSISLATGETFTVDFGATIATLT